MQYDDLYQYTGDMGRYQWVVFAVMFAVTISCVEIVNMIFVGGEMDHWCRIESLSNLSSDQQKYIAIPTSDDDVIVRYSGCAMFDVNWTTYDVTELTSWNRTEWIQDGGYNVTNTRPCSAWNYDQSMFTSTIVSRFDLVCGKEFLVELVTTIHTLGILVGTITSGAVSDRFGRKVALAVYLSIKCVGSAMAILANDYVTFVIGRLITGIGSCGVGLTAFVVVMEMVGPKRRTLVGVLFQVAYSLGFMLTPIIAYFVRDDFYLQIATMAPSIIFIPFAITMTESPRWLIVRGRYNEALKVFQRICATNRTTLPDDLDLSNLEEETTVKDRGCTSLMRSPTMRRTTLLVDFSWFTSALVYCALTMFSNYQEMSANLYINTFISGAVEIPVSIITVFLVDTKLFGRRGMAGISLIAAGVISFLCALLITFEFHLAVMILSLLGKACITLAYTVVYLYGSEIFPTEVRNVGLATASAMEDIGAMSAPAVGGPMKRLWLPLPSIIYGILSSISGLSYLLLPETRRQPLPDTIEQADKMAALQNLRRRKKRKTTANGSIHCIKEDAATEVSLNGLHSPHTQDSSSIT